MEVSKNGKYLFILRRALELALAVCLLSLSGFLTINAVEKYYTYPLKYKEYVFEYADSYGLDRALVFSIIKTESNFDKDAVSSVGAKGLMQITDGTSEYIAKRLGIENYDIFDVKTNIAFGTYYLKYLLVKFKDEKTTLCAYNAGEGNVSLWLMNSEYSEDGKTIKTIPIRQTRNYVEKIYKSFGKYKKIYRKLLDKRENFE